MELLLIVIAIVCFVLAAIPLAPRIPWLPIGLAFFALAHIATSLVVGIK